jgi:hypothetical protein
MSGHNSSIDWSDIVKYLHEYNAYAPNITVRPNKALGFEIDVRMTRFKSCLITIETVAIPTTSIVEEHAG